MEQRKVSKSPGTSNRSWTTSGSPARSGKSADVREGIIAAVARGAIRPGLVTREEALAKAAEIQSLADRAWPPEEGRAWRLTLARILRVNGLTQADLISYRAPPDDDQAWRAAEYARRRDEEDADRAGCTVRELLEVRRMRQAGISYGTIDEICLRRPSWFWFATWSYWVIFRAGSGR